jgi:Tol biopolymer transport system component/DNA-binding winged helix-turn-helix (wHTH) protein
MSTRPKHLYEFGPFRLDTAEQLLLRDGKPLPLTPKAFEMLVALVEHSGHLVEKEELMKVVWADAFVEESNLTNNVSALRKLLGQGKGGQNYIETVPKRGYRFTAAVRELSPETLVVEKRTLTRIVTEETEEEPPSRGLEIVPESTPPRSSTLFGTRAPRSLLTLLITALIVVGSATAFGIYWLIARRQASNRTMAVPFSVMDISPLTTSGKVTHSAISSDGKYLANVVKAADGNSLWVKQIAAPSNVRIAGPAVTEYISVMFTPDGGFIYYITLDHDKGESTLYRVPVLGGRSEVLANDIYPIGFSPDGGQIAFIRMRRSESTLVVADANGANQRVLTTRHKPDFFELEWNAPAWSPDGKTIACAVRLNDQSGHYDTIMIVNATEGTQRPVGTQRWDWVGQPMWLPNNKGLLVTASDRPGYPLQIWHIDLAGGPPTRITHDLNNYFDLSITADAKRLAVVQVHTVSNISVAPNADASNTKQISSEIGSLESLAWTRDGQIVYRSSAGGNGADIWIMKGDGSNAKQLTVGARVARGLAVTPDGRHIIFSSDATGKFNLWRVDADGGNLRQLTAGNGEFYPQCTPDAQWVVYQSDEVIDPRVWKVPTDSGQPVQLTNGRAAKPAVSPDGQWIAYSYLDVDLKPSRWGIGIISSGGGQRLNRFDFPPTVVDRNVRWSPDGKSVAFLNSPGGRTDVWLQPLDGSAPKQLTNFKAEQIIAFDWSPDGRSLAFVRNVETSDVVLIEQK